MRDILAELKRQDIAAYIGGAQERAGKATRVQPCPLCGHNDCFTIYADTNTYKCFSCGKSGSIIDYVIDLGEAGDVAGAIEKLCEHYHIKIERSKDEKIEGVPIAEINQVFELAVVYYHQCLLACKPALEYLERKRGRSRDVIESEMYGYAGSQQGLKNYLTSKKIPMNVQIASGLVLPGKDGKEPFDLFGKGQIIYPGYVSGKPCDFTAKALDRVNGRDYRLRADNRLRNCLFYGQDALYHNDVILVEGQEDRNSILELGGYHVAAILGSLSEEQVKMLQERTEGKRVYLCFDNDEAGEKYTQRLSLALSSSLVYICQFEDAKDIDEWLRQGRTKGDFDQMIRRAVEPIHWHLERIPEELPPREFKLALQPTLQIIANEPDEIIRSQYLVMAEEILKAKPKVASALNRAVKMIIKQQDAPNMDEGEFERSVGRKGTIYIKVTKDSFRAISGFVMDIVRYIEDDEVLYYEVILHTYNGASRPIVLSNEQRINTKLFDAALSAVGPYYFYGRLCDLKEIWQLEEERAQIKSWDCRFNRYGWIAKHKIWLFANCAYKAGKMYLPEEGRDLVVIDKIGFQSKNVKIYGGDKPVLDVDGNPSREYVHEVVKLFNTMWDSDKSGRIVGFKGFMALGFMVSTLYLAEITAKENKFPYILAFGPPGTGKSEAMQFIMNMFGFRSGGENWGEATSAGISMAMEQLSGIPYWLEEFSNTMGASTRQQAKVEILKNIYNRSSGGKGGLTGRTVYEVNASLFLSGQDRPENQAFLSRCVVLRKELPSEAGTSAYYRLKSEGRKLSLVTRWVLENKTEEAVGRYWDNYDAIMGEMKRLVRQKQGELNERTAVNYAILAAGFGMLDYHEKDNEFLDWIVSECINDMARKNAEDIVYRFFSDIEIIFHEEMSAVVSRNQSELYINYNLVYNEWLRNLRATGMQEYIGREGLLDYLRRDPHEYWIEARESRGYHRKYFRSGGVSKQVRCIGIYIDRLPDNIREIVQAWDIQMEFI